MWELRTALPFGRLSVRKFLMLAATVLVAVLMYALATTPVAHAQGAQNGSEAQWKGESIMYKGEQYIKLGTAKEGDSHGLAPGTVIYQFLSESGDKAKFLYFRDGTDPPAADSVNFTVFDYGGEGNYSNRHGDKTISITPRAESAAGETTSCAYDGLGWAICPITDFLAEAMDWIFGVLAQFLVVQPLKTTEDNSLFRLWSIMRDFANVAFVIGFLIVIYSQVTNMGLSNYGIKNILPRLIIAAILVNISYWVCAIAIDLSNITGYALQDIFMNMRNQIVGEEGNGWQLVNWTNVTSFILSAGAGGTAAYFTLISIGSISGALHMLLPILVLVLLSAMVALIVMAARQAIIVILVILAPLAFVAYLLPNTEKYFDKWKDTFITMLVLFPIFAVLFGGAQVAGTTIIHNARTIVMLLLGMAVQIVPLVILPFLIKFGGGLLAKVGGDLNTKSKGLSNKVRDFSQRKADLKKSEMLAKNNGQASFRRNPLANRVQNADFKRRVDEGKIKANETLADANWANTEAYRKIHASSAQAELQKKTNETMADAHWINSNAYHRAHEASTQAELHKQIAEMGAEEHLEARKLVAGEMQDLDIHARASKLGVDLTKAKVDANWEGVQAGFNPNTGKVEASYPEEHNDLDRTVLATQIASRDLALAGLRKRSAERSRSEQLTQDLLQDTATIDGKVLSEYGGGVLGTKGAETVLAGAVNDFRSEYKARVSERAQLMYHFNISSGEKQILAMGSDNIVRTKNGVTYTFKVNDEYTREAAIDEQLKKGSFADIEKIIMASGARKDSDGKIVEKGATYEFASSISDAIADYKLAGKAAYYGSRTINDVAQGNVYGQEGLDNAAVYHLMNGKLKDNDVAAMDASALKRLFEVSTHDASGAPTRRAADSTDYQQAVAAGKTELINGFRENSNILRHSAYRILENPLLRNTTSEAAKKVLEQYATQPPDNTTP